MRLQIINLIPNERAKMHIRVQKIKKINAVEVLAVGTALSIMTISATTAYDGVDKNWEKLKTLGFLFFGLYVVSTVYCLKKLNDAGQLGTIYKNARAKVDAEYEAKKIVVDESKPQSENKPHKYIKVPNKAKQKQHKKPKPTIGLLSRLMNSFSSKKTPIDATPLVDDSVDEVKHETLPEKSKQQKHHPRRRNKHKAINSSEQAPKTPELKKSSTPIQSHAVTPSKSDNDGSESDSEGENDREKSLPSFSSSTIQILALTPRQSEGNNVSKSENENRELFSSSTSTPQLLPLASSDNESKINPTTPKNITPPNIEAVVLSEPPKPDVLSISPVVNEEKNTPTLQSLAEQLEGVKLDLQKLQIVNQPPAVAAIENESAILTATKLIEEMKAVLPSEKEALSHTSEHENKLNKSFPSSTMQIFALTPSKSNSDIASERENERKDNPITPSVEPVSSEPLQQPNLSSTSSSANVEKNALIVDSLADQVVRLTLEKLQNLHQIPAVAPPPVATAVENKSPRLSATQLTEEMKAVLPSVKEALSQASKSEDQKHEDKSKGNTAELTGVLKNLLLQSSHLATLAALQDQDQDPLKEHRREHGVCTAVGNFQNLCRRFIEACKQQGIDMSEFNTPNPAFLPTRRFK